ncbi:hypothetical protein O1611_g5654 [Lasiodiplodia mahajangana]|uniref:Uncharacterized protein n=1 Tax=Lasiodiplodia mahajangana TaxID=1108764 RepID=A0ACC2JKL7_9PEZI|nr:hypothetical protein O1611_g5654 [Lasiodiplodia mahajangana]
MASFHNSFSDVTLHNDLLLEWDRANATYYPLVIRARVLNKTSEYNANTIEAEISSGLTDNTFLWRDLPFPLPFFSTATYELQVLGQQQAVGMLPELVIASSPSFIITPPRVDESNGGQIAINGTSDDPFEPTNSSHSGGPPNSSTAIAAGLVVPFVVGLSVFVFLCMRRRQKRIDEERRKERQGLVID